MASQSDVSDTRNDTSLPVAVGTLVACLLLVALGSIFSMRWAVLGMAVFTGLGVAARAIDPERYGFLIRHRGWDIAALGSLTVALLFLGTTTVLD